MIFAICYFLITKEIINNFRNVINGDYGIF